MPTPGSGAISMNDMRSNINRATSSSISMSEMRARYGGSGQISFSDLRNCEGFTITAGTQSSKFATSDGWDDDAGFGSISPNEGDGRVQFAANSWINAFQESSFDPGVTYIYLQPTSTATTYNGDQVTAGFKTTNLSRVVIANTSYGITSASSNSSTSQAKLSYNMPASGTLHCLFKF